MPDSRRRRGPHPHDEDGFSDVAHAALQTAAAELSWLLTRGYSKRAATKLVGDRHNLRTRQRQALQRCAASEQSCAKRGALELSAASLEGQPLLIDGYNVILTLEAALCGGAILVGRDGALRDMAAMSRHYRRVTSTVPAIELVATHTRQLGCSELRWYLDRPISNSGRLAAMILELAQRNRWPWQVELVADPDRTLIDSGEIVATSDSGILERCRGWFNLTAHIIELSIPDAWVIDLRSG